MRTGKEHTDIKKSADPELISRFNREWIFFRALSIIFVIMLLAGTITILGGYLA